MVVSLYAGLLAVVFMLLSLNVILGRYKYRVALGDGHNFEMQRRIRAHANFVEYTPFFLILIMFAEMQGLAHQYVHALCALFLFGRIMHALSITKIEKYDGEKILAYPIWRSVGMVSSITAIVTAALVLIGKGL